MKNSNSVHGFSLVELSIVLVILGLLSGGILGGQSLIRAAELRSLTTDSQRYMTALYTFRDKYFAVPGDMRNATQFWGVLAGDGSNAACQNTEATGAATCNGDGDGFIGGSSTSGVAHDERFRAWQHLANAGLVEGSYTGRTDSSTSGSFITTAGKNVPRARISNTHMRFVADAGTSGASATHFTGIPGGNRIEFRDNAGNSAPLIPEEQWNLDVKTDDGLAGMGKVFSHKQTSTAYPNCATTDVRETALYNLSDRSKRCVFDILVN